MSLFVDAVLFKPTAGGTTDWVVDTAVVGYTTPAIAGAQNDMWYTYRAEDASLAQWEIGLGVYSSALGRITRSKVLLNSAGTTAKIDFATIPSVGLVASATDLMNIGEVTPEVYGAVGDGVADDTIPLQYWAMSPYPKAGRAKRYKVSGTIAFTASSCIDWRGMIIDGSAGGTWTGSAVVSSAGSITQLPNISSQIPVGYAALPFVGPHGLSRGDVVIIYNPTDYSYSGQYYYARAGEFVRIEYPTSSSDAKLFGSLNATYNANAVNLYKMAKHEVKWRNLEVITPNTGYIRPVNLDLVTSGQLHAIKGRNSRYVSISLTRCYNIDLFGCTAEVCEQYMDSTYGLAIGNSQDIRVHGGDWNAVRHAITLGGDDYVCSVPCRDILVMGATIKNDSVYSLEAAMDIHANSEGVRVIGCVIYGGGNLNGSNIEYNGCHFKRYGDPATCPLIGGSYWVGGFIKIIGCTIECGPANNTGSYGAWRLYCGTTTSRDTLLFVKDNIINTANANIMCYIEHRASIKVRVNISNISLWGTGLGALTYLCYLVGNGSNVIEYMSLKDVIGMTAAVTYAFNSGTSVQKWRLPQQSGTVGVSGVSASSTGEVVVTFPHRYPAGINPNVACSQAEYNINGHTPVAIAYGVLPNQFTALIRTGDATAAGADWSLSYKWVASVD